MSFENVKVLPRAALITEPGSGCVGSWEENLLAKRSPEKTTRGHAYKQNNYGTRPRDRRSTLLDKQINKSDDAIMWLYTLSKQHNKSDWQGFFPYSQGDRIIAHRVDKFMH